MHISPMYSKCASENSYCPFVGKRSVAYGSDDGKGTFFYRNLSNGTPCNNKTFASHKYPAGDPATGHTKACYVSLLPADFVSGSKDYYDVHGVPTNWAKCSNQGQLCKPININTPVDILYGANGSYVYANAAAVDCSPTTFGNTPAGNSNACYWRTSRGPQQAYHAASPHTHTHIPAHTHTHAHHPPHPGTPSTPHSIYPHPRASPTHQ
jgi:hypothetical protein